MSLEQRIRGALWGLYIFDALSMPVHWYYSVSDLKKDFGYISTYQAPKLIHPGSIMAVSNTGGHGRGGQEGNIIGDVINHGKKQFWGKRNVHYHQGMHAGENTLNAICARVVTRSITTHGGYNQAGSLEDYVRFMTTPGSHNDTYAESFHRDFFANYARGVPASACARGTEGHNTAAVGGLVMLPPVVLSVVLQGGDAGAASKAALSQLQLTHDSPKLNSYAQIYTSLLADLALGAEPRARIVEACKAAGHPRVEALALSDIDSTEAIHSVFGSACYIDSSLPVVLFLAYRFATTPGSADASAMFTNAALANTNAGGENCHRGSALGALLGAMAGVDAVPAALKAGLHDSANIAREIDEYVAALLKSK